MPQFHTIIRIDPDNYKEELTVALPTRIGHLIRYRINKTYQEAVIDSRPTWHNIVRYVAVADDYFDVKTSDYQPTQPTISVVEFLGGDYTPPEPNVPTFNDTFHAY